VPAPGDSVDVADATADAGREPRSSPADAQSAAGRRAELGGKLARLVGAVDPSRSGEWRDAECALVERVRETPPADPVQVIPGFREATRMPLMELTLVVQPTVVGQRPGLVLSFTCTAPEPCIRRWRESPARRPEAVLTPVHDHALTVTAPPEGAAALTMEVTELVAACRAPG
jgi:hypothetical protein